MKAFLKHAGLIVLGLGAVAVAVLVPPVAPFLGPIATKLILAGGGSLALAAASPTVIANALAAVKK